MGLGGATPGFGGGGTPSGGGAGGAITYLKEYQYSEGFYLSNTFDKFGWKKFRIRRWWFWFFFVFARGLFSFGFGFSHILSENVKTSLK